MTNPLIRLAATAACLGMASGLALAGVVLEFETRTAGHDKPDQAGTIYVESDRLRVHGDAHDAIYRGDKQLIWLVDEKKAAYQEMTKEQAAGMMTEVQKQLESLPPEQQKMVAQMMAGKMGPGAAAGKKEAPVTFVKTGKTETIAGYPCVSYDAMRGGKREQELWVTDWKRVDIRPADFDVLQDFGAFVKESMGPMAGRFSTGLEQKFSDKENADAIPGVPIRIVTFQEGGDRITEMKKVAKQEIPAKTFEVPAGMQKQPMMMMERHRAD